LIIIAENYFCDYFLKVGFYFFYVLVILTRKSVLITLVPMCRLNDIERNSFSFSSMTISESCIIKTKLNSRCSLLYIRWTTFVTVRAFAVRKIRVWRNKRWSKQQFFFYFFDNYKKFFFLLAKPNLFSQRRNRLIVRYNKHLFDFQSIFFYFIFCYVILLFQKHYRFVIENNSKRIVYNTL